MIQISHIQLPPGFAGEDIRQRLRKEKIPPEASLSLRSLSLDARDKRNIHYLASVGAAWPGEEAFLRRRHGRNISRAEEPVYRMPEPGTARLAHRPLIVGAGPAGLFAARVLAEAGYAPVILERGAPVEERTAEVARFWRDGILNPDSNVQFGEGGAGTFSDGKLTTRVKERGGRIRQVLAWFVEAGADPSLLYWNKPHIGTDVLPAVVKNLREKILSLGGTFCFRRRAVGFEIRESAGERRLTAVETEDEEGRRERIETEAVILAVGHSARDTLEELARRSVPMQPKPFAVGVRIEHPQDMINASQYGAEAPAGLPAADYRLSARAGDGRGVYSFCMCPGGQVVNASSEPGRIAVNGMSRAARDGRNANAALVVSVSPEDFGGEDALAGMRYQRQIERAAWEAGEGNIPVQLLGDFLQDVPSRALGGVEPDLCGGYRLGSLRRALPEAVAGALTQTLPSMGEKIAGFDRPDALLSGVESRTSSPVRILRDPQFESEVKGLYPCGEGAGYAGGITSAAVDGMRTAEEIIRRYRRWEARD